MLSLNVITILVALLSAALLQFGKDRTERIERVELSGSLSEVQIDDAGDRVFNILLVGSDSSAGLDPDNPVAIGRVGEQNSDVMIVAHFDERDGTAALLSLPRDLWVEIAATGREAKLNSAFALGGPAELIDTIELNFDIPINYYVNVDFAGFQGVVEAVGSVPIYFAGPTRDWNPEYNRSQTGFVNEAAGCVDLGPVEALAYVRSRHYQILTSDLEWKTDPTGDFGRIRRQQDFLKRLIGKAIDEGARNPFVLNDLIDSALDSIVIDQALTPQTLLDIGRQYSSFEPEELQTYTYPAVFDSVGSISILRGIDAQAAPLEALFAGAASDDPVTVLVQVKSDAASSELLGLAVGALEESGFEPVTMPSGATGPGFVVEHGPDGRRAADLVLAALVDDEPLGLDSSRITVVEIENLSGREVRVTIGDPDVEPPPAPTTVPGAPELAPDVTPELGVDTAC